MDASLQIKPLLVSQHLVPEIAAAAKGLFKSSACSEVGYRRSLRTLYCFSLDDIVAARLQIHALLLAAYRNVYLSVKLPAVSIHYPYRPNPRHVKSF
ncbi:hypothetical protein M5E87_16420 [Flavonifractor plautii]|nr:hypothetical protein M5E87_16420 [Flavonifractor plautii]